ncbi:MAG: OsmC family protein [Clostridiaceae bacterium]|nr:OsmC family protein [Eubacteriales bacterium]
MKEPVHATIRRINGGVRLRADVEGKPSLEIDSAPPYGAGDTLSAMELFLTSLCGCSGGTVLALLNKMRKTILSFSIEAEGTRLQEPPMRFSTITLKFRLASPNTTEEELKKIIRLAGEKYCPVWAMIKNTVEVETEAEVAAG